MATTVRDHMVDRLVEVYTETIGIVNILMNGHEGFDNMSDQEIFELYREVVLDGAPEREVWKK